MKDELQQGKIKQYDPEKGFGFIGTPEGDVFFHISDFPAAEGEPKRNERVKFVAVENGEKFKAVRIERVEDTSAKAKKSKVSTIPSIFALHQTPAQLSSPHKFTPNHPPDESRLLSIRPPNPTCSRRSASWRIQTLYPRPHRQTSCGFVPAVQRARSRTKSSAVVRIHLYAFRIALSTY